MTTLNNGQTTENPFGLHQMDLTAVYIDGPNFYMTTKVLDPEHNVDFAKLRDLFASNTRIQDIAYYTALRETPTDGDGHSPLIPLIDWMGNNGYRVIEKTARVVATDRGEKVKGSVNMDIGVDAMNAAFCGLTHIVLFVSDGDMAPLIPALKSRGCRVTVVSTRRNKIVSEDLRWEADNFVDLDRIMHMIVRDKVRGPRRNSEDRPAGERLSGRLSLS